MVSLGWHAANATVLARKTPTTTGGQKENDVTEWNLAFDGKSTADDVLADLDLSGKTAIVTGANVGIGFETARALAAKGAHVVLACRSEPKGEKARGEILGRHPLARVSVKALDLSSLDSVRHFANDLTGEASLESIDMLICNAGRFGGGYSETREGHEMTVGVCHIAHFLLVQLLLERVVRAHGRVVMVSSESHRNPKTLDFDNFPLSRSNYSDLVAYGQAKLCNVLMAKELQRRFSASGITAYSLHPGTLVPTAIGRNSILAKVLIQVVRPFTKGLGQGAATSVLCAAHPEAERAAGEYFSNCRPVRSSRESCDQGAAAKLWQVSEKWVAAE